MQGASVLAYALASDTSPWNRWGIGEDCRAVGQFLSFEWIELFRSRAAEELRAVSSHAVAAHVVGLAAEEWVARCTAPGLKGYRAARRPYGSVMA
jgi:hypothetical protein